MQEDGTGLRVITTKKIFAAWHPEPARYPRHQRNQLLMEILKPLQQVCRQLGKRLGNPLSSSHGAILETP